MLFERFVGPEAAQALVPLLDNFDKISDEQITAATIDAVRSTLVSAMQQEGNMDATIQEAREEYRKQNLTRAQAFAFADNLVMEMKGEVDTLNLGTARSQLLYVLAETLAIPFYAAADIVDNNDVTIGFQLIHENAKVPAYAHDDDACADVYAIEDTVIPKHGCGVAVRTGLKALIPQGWLLELRARSGMSKNSPLRISNSVGTIDAGYKGEIMVLFDNISGKDYEIKAGDRIAQMRPEPAYRFRSEIIENVGDSERGEGGFGSSGK